MKQLTGTQQTIYNILVEQPLSAQGIADKMSYDGTSTVYDHISAIRENGYEVRQNEIGEYYIPGENPLNESSHWRQNDVAKQTITRKANKFFAELEATVKPRLTRYEPPVANGGLEYNSGGYDILIPVTDTHIGDLVITRGEEIYNTEIAIERIREIFREAHSYVDRLKKQGIEIDTVHVPLMGDIVTNEAIYDGQPWHVDSTVKTQIRKAVEVLDEEIARLASHFSSVQVICQHGNHGEFRVDGSSNQANADDFVYSMLDYLVRKGDYNNITVIRDEHDNSINFTMRNGIWNVHMRHGEDTRGHVGTSSPREDWQNWKDEYNFDLALYGHYHQYRVEPLSDGTFVMMCGTTAPPGEYEESMSMFGGEFGAIHLVSDENVLEDTTYIYFNED